MSDVRGVGAWRFVLRNARMAYTWWVEKENGWQVLKDVEKHDVSRILDRAVHLRLAGYILRVGRRELKSMAL